MKLGGTMLRLLHIENIAVIENVDIEFSTGMNVLTGETGAGKSIVIDALSVVTGGRTSHELIRTGADSASVTAVFSDIEGSDWFEDNGVTMDESGEIYIILIPSLLVNIKDFGNSSDMVITFPSFSFSLRKF